MVNTGTKKKALTMVLCFKTSQPKDDSEANGSEPSTLSSPVSGGGHHGEAASRETTDTEAAGEPGAAWGPVYDTGARAPTVNQSRNNPLSIHGCVPSDRR